MADTFELSADLADRALEIVEIARNSGKIKKGMNEVTKVVERGRAKLVVVANDIAPAEIAMHLPMICNEKKILFIKAGTKKEIGKINSGEILHVMGTDPGSKNDIPGWCERSGHEFMGLKDEDGYTSFFIKKG